MPVGRVVCGGQTGVDRAALDVAVALGIPYGGWCPRGGWAEDMPEPPGLLTVYPELVPTPAADPEQRTRWNVRDSQATAIITTAGTVSAGTALALACVFELGRELAVIDAAAPEEGLRDARGVLARMGPETSLNVAGPRESEQPGIYLLATEVLERLLAPSG